jgi:phenylalanyl-tRNA synthetase alpha chain
MQNLIVSLEQTMHNFSTALIDVQTINDLNQLKSIYIVKNSAIDEAFSMLRQLSLNEKKHYGPIINNIKKQLDDLYYKKLQQLNIDIKSTTINDCTLPGHQYLQQGKKHILNEALNKLITIMQHLGFSVVVDREIEDDWHNFEALNIPKFHPARKMQDTFYIADENLILRTHTSSVQARCLTQNNDESIAVMSIGRVYRVDESDSTHLPMFHQMEIIYIADDASLIKMKTIITEILELFFMKKVTLRFRSSYFPFTEPSLEVDIQLDNGVWLEIMGCGMVHPNVLINIKHSNAKSAFACGIGIERLLMLQYPLDDIRNLVINDIRWIKHFGQ